MSSSERLAGLVFWLIWIGIAAGITIGARALVTGDMPFEASPDRQTGTSALLVATDAGTGCQYILTPWGGIVPRTGRDGRQICAALAPTSPDQPSR